LAVILKLIALNSETNFIDQNRQQQKSNRIVLHVLWNMAGFLDLIALLSETYFIDQNRRQQQQQNGW
jgi:hypothetical protein